MGWRRSVAILAGCLLLVLGAAAPAHAQFQFLTQWGGPGSANGRFAGNPSDLATDSSGNVYVVDTGNDRVQRFTPAGVFASKWGSSGSGNSQFAEPSGIDVGPQGWVYVADSGNDRVQMFSGGGEFLDLWGGPTVFEVPFGIATSGAGNVYVTSGVASGEIGKFTPTGGLPTPDASFGFDEAAGVTVDRQGYVWVVDPGADEVHKLDPLLNPVATFGSFGGAALSGPSGITADPSGNLYVVDSGNDRVLRVAPQGGLLGQLPGSFVNPFGAATDCRGNVYVTDGNAVKKFGDPGDPPPPCEAPRPAGLLVEVDAARKQRLKRIAVTVTCVLEDCVAQAGGKAKAGKKRSALAGQEKELEAGVPTTFELDFQGDNQIKRIRRAMRKKKVRRKAKVKFVVLARDDQGTVDVERANSKLRR